MTCELRPTEYISEFVSGGSKNYAYGTIDTTTCQTDSVRKVRGNYNASQLVNFEVIRDMILGTGGKPTVTVHTERKGGRTLSIVTEPEDKLYRISYFKRRRLDEIMPVPFGYK